MAPNLLMFTVFVGIPIIGGLALSFTNWDLTGLPQWAGLANYKEMFSDPLVGMAVKTTLKFLVLGVVPTVIISLGLAMLINFQFRFVGVVRSLYLIPAAVSFAASALIWQFIFRPGNQGLLDYVLSLFGIPGPGWLSSTTWALPALDIITIWLALPTATILYLAALQRIPDSVIEAAMLDGAGRDAACASHHLAGRAVYDRARRDRRAAGVHKRLVRPRQHPHPWSADLCHTDAHLLHLLHGVHQRPVRLRRCAVGAPDRDHRRTARRARGC